LPLIRGGLVEKKKKKKKKLMFDQSKPAISMRTVHGTLRNCQSFQSRAPPQTRNPPVVFTFQLLTITNEPGACAFPMCGGADYTEGMFEIPGYHQTTTTSYHVTAAAALCIRNDASAMLQGRNTRMLLSNPRYRCTNFVPSKRRPTPCRSYPGTIFGVVAD
jgi:hypothetical protein